MMNSNEIEAVIFAALNSVNNERDEDNKIEISSKTALFGTDAVLDSLDLVSVIVDVETAIFEQSNHDVSLSDDRAMNQEVSPFRDVETLVAYVKLVLSEAE